jgi:hypothetical protein
MPGFEEKYQPANPFASVPTPWREDPAPAPHPYPGWKPTARGDSSALAPYLGSAAGLFTTAEALVPAAAMTLAGAAAGGCSALTDIGHAAGSAMAHHHRTAHYASYSGMDLNHEQAASFADYDDAKAAAIERSKAEHPERWGHNPNNPTYGQAFAHMLTDVTAQTGGAK